MSLMAPPAPSVGQLGLLGVSDGGVLAVHPAWWAATRAFDGVGWMQLFGTACSHLCDGSVSRRRQCGWRGPLIRVDGCMRVCASQNNSYGGQRRHGWRSEATGLAGGRAVRACRAALDACALACLRCRPGGNSTRRLQYGWKEPPIRVDVCMCACASRRWLVVDGYMVQLQR